jgi:hypothetical protein
MRLVPLPFFEVVLLPSRIIGISNVCFEKPGDRYSSTTGAVFSGPEKLLGKHSNRKPCRSGSSLRNTSLSAGWIFSPLGISDQNSKMSYIIAITLSVAF